MALPPKVKNPRLTGRGIGPGRIPAKTVEARTADGRFPNSTAEVSAVGVSSRGGEPVQEPSRQDRTWEHWPGRRIPDDGIRHRLRELFTPTDDDQLEALIGQRSREIEEQTARLQATLEGLEHREEQAARLRSAVEEMLRVGSAELDDRQAELTTLAAELRAREERLGDREREIATRTQELGAVELRRAAVERREEAAREREDALEAAAAELRARELKLRDLANELEDGRRTGGAPTEEKPSVDTHAHLLYVADDRYRLLEGDGPAPRVGAVLELDGKRFEVLRVGRSLLPGDRRALAYLEPAVDAPEPTAAG